MRHLQGNCHKAFLKDSVLVRVAWQAHYWTHQPNYEHEGDDDMSLTFKEMATSASLMGSEVYEVKEAWTGQRNLKPTYNVAKASRKDIHSSGWCLPPSCQKSWA